LIADGEFGFVPYLHCAAEAGISYLSRLSRYELLDDPLVRERLRTARWERVRDSGGGPTRHATDLGEFAIPAGPKTLREDGTPYGPAVARVVVSYYRAGAESKGRGHRIGDYIFEMFVVIGLSNVAWPAAHVVTAYYGRCGLENRFEQADRELDLDMAHSFHLDGHLLTLLCGLFVWNWRVVEGVPRNPLPERVDAQALEIPEIGPTPDIPPLESSPTPQAPPAAESNPAAVEEPPAPEPDKVEISEAPSEASDARSGETGSQNLDKVLVGIDFDALLRRRPGWTWDLSTRTLTDDHGVQMKLAVVNLLGERSAELRFKGSDSANHFA